MLCFVIHLITNHTASVGGTLHQFPDYSFCIKPENRMRNIHNLTGSVNSTAIYCFCQYIRMGFHHPCRNCIGRRSDNYMDASFFHCIHYFFHMGKIKDPFLRLTGTPGRFCNPDRIDASFLHHLYIFS